MIIVQTPLRVSLFGGGTDFPSYFLSEGGCVLTSAIDKYIFVIIKDRFDEKLRIGYTRTEIVDSIDEIAHELIREALRKTNITKGVEILTMGDIPAGSGLGSSSVVTVGALHALYTYQNMLVSRDRLAQEACDIEVGILGKPIGYQDQYIASFGGLQFVEFQKDGTVQCATVEIAPEVRKLLSQNIMLFFTGTTRKAESILTEQKENIKNNLPVLRELKQMAHAARDSLLSGKVDEIGTLLHASWQLKKRLASNITNDELDVNYQLAISAGALGGKITGAGGGGFLMLYCPVEKQAAVRAALQQMHELPVQLEKDGSKVIFNYR